MHGLLMVSFVDVSELNLNLVEFVDSDTLVGADVISYRSLLVIASAVGVAASLLVVMFSVSVIADLLFQQQIVLSSLFVVFHRLTEVLA